MPGSPNWEIGSGVVSAGAGVRASRVTGPPGRVTAQLAGTAKGLALRDPSVWGIARAAGSPRAGVPPPGRPARCTSRSGWASGSSTNATRSSPSRDGCGRRWSFAPAVRRVRRRRPRRRCRAWSRPVVRGHRGDAVVVGRGSGQRKPEGEPAERELDLDRLFVDQRHLRTVRSSHVNALVLLPRRRESCPTSAPRGRCELVGTGRNT